jgi:FlaA1/EpsC-like NDP-sugar epimerase
MIDYIKIFLILFLISVYFSNDFLSCDIREYCKNIYVKHIITFCLIFLIVIESQKNSFKSSEEDEPILPELIINALIIHALFILSLKMNFKFTMVIVALAVVYYLLDVEKSNKTDIENIEASKKIIKIAILIIGIVGFYYYFIEKYSKHRREFSLPKFLLGNEKCTTTSETNKTNKNTIYQSL